MPEESESEVDQVTCCPFCGHSGALDGKGQRVQRKSRLWMEEGVEEEYIERRYRFHCPSCSNEWEAVEKQTSMGYRRDPENELRPKEEVVSA